MRNVSVKDAGSRLASVVRELCSTTGRRGLWQTRPLEPDESVGAPVAPLFFSRSGNAPVDSKSISEFHHGKRRRPALLQAMRFNLKAIFFPSIIGALAGLYRCFLFFLCGWSLPFKAGGFVLGFVCFICSKSIWLCVLNERSKLASLLSYCVCL